MKIEVEQYPFGVPDAVLMKLPPSPKESGFNPTGASILLKELDPVVLSGLCDDFRESIFKKAGKEDPKKICPSDLERP